MENSFCNGVGRRNYFRSKWGQTEDLHCAYGVENRLHCEFMSFVLTQSEISWGHQKIGDIRFE